MSICITGDTHGGFQRFSADNFPQQRQMGGMTSQWLQAILEACGTILPGRHTTAQLAGQKAVYDSLCGWKPRKH